jgi:1-acyl-sn-glycerol-3-phosphate acyltransferase
MFTRIKIAWRISRLVFHIISGMLLAAIFLRRTLPPGSFAAILSTRWHARTCKIFGVKHEIFGEINPTPTLFVANHISWFDIPSIGAVIPLHFLAKDEIASWPVIGWLAHKTGTLFIRRGSKDAAKHSIAAMVNALKKGGHVLVFPEGTTHNGVKVGHFHSRLLQAAFDAGVTIQPIAVTYPHADGIHPHAPYVGDVQMLHNALAFMAADDMAVALHFLPALNPNDFASRDTITDNAKQLIAAVVENQPLAQ